MRISPVVSARRDATIIFSRLLEVRPVQIPNFLNEVTNRLAIGEITLCDFFEGYKTFITPDGVGGSVSFPQPSTSTAEPGRHLWPYSRYIGADLQCSSDTNVTTWAAGTLRAAAAAITLIPMVTGSRCTAAMGRSSPVPSSRAAGVGQAPRTAHCRYGLGCKTPVGRVAAGGDKSNAAYIYAKYGAGGVSEKMPAGAVLTVVGQSALKTYSHDPIASNG